MLTSKHKSDEVGEITQQILFINQQTCEDLITTDTPITTQHEQSYFCGEESQGALPPPQMSMSVITALDVTPMNTDNESRSSV